MGGTLVDVYKYLDDIVEQKMPKFLFYRKDRTTGSADVYCTSCHSREMTSNKPFIKGLKHKKDAVCLWCGNVCECRQMDYGRTTYKYWGNFVVFEKDGDGLNASAIKIRQSFEEDYLEPVYDWYETTRYSLHPHNAVQYKWHWKNEWIPKKSKPSEPCFNFGLFNSGYSHYGIAGFQEEKQGTYMQYLFDLENEAVPEKFMVYISRIAEHPNIEYLLHGGLGRIADDYVSSKLKSRINWRSNDLKKMLKLSKKEIEFMKRSEGSEYDEYILFHKRFGSKNEDEIIRNFENYKSCNHIMQTISDKTKLNYKQIIKYADKHKNAQGSYFILSLWLDYLRQCEKLEYDMSDHSVLMPRKLFDAHDRTAKLIKIKNDELTAKQLKRFDQMREGMEYVDKERGLCVILPKSVGEIVAEGKALSHCVGGYADRHVDGKLTILFIRLVDDPETPFYTMEVDTEGKIVQCRGFANNVEMRGGKPKPDFIKDFETDYAKYLKKLFADKCKKARKKKAA